MTADRLAPFRSPILAIRAATVAVGFALASLDLSTSRPILTAWCLVVTGYAVFRAVRPLAYADDTASLVRVVAEVAIHVLAVVGTGYWASPFVFSLVTAIIVAGFARGFAFSLRIGAASAAAVTLPMLADAEDLAADGRLSAQWTLLLLLVALVAGYARRITGDADRRHTLALDRLGRLADANALLYSLHRVAQTLPASLDLDEVVDSTMARLRDLLAFDAAAVLVHDETDGTWIVARREGTRLPGRLATGELAPQLRRAAEGGRTVVVPNLLDGGGPGLAPSAGSGVYAVLPARGSVIGLVSVEWKDAGRPRDRDVELLEGLAEPAALAIDNARWFSRLRTVSADEERLRIARDLHDRIGQSLAYLAFELDRIVKHAGSGRDVGPALEGLRADVRGVIREVRDTLYDLRTEVSEESDVPTTLAAFLERVRERSGVEVTLETRATGRLPLPQERELWRIAQEAIVNVERHARASELHVRWRTDGRVAELEVADDGVGFPRGRAGRLDSYGILGMRERASSIGATLEIASAEGRGTTVRCRLGTADVLTKEAV
ncbi:MAG TPA: GAF domain-containing sensor histidine kinase [Acidimicrobiales bacterium]